MKPILSLLLGGAMSAFGALPVIYDASVGDSDPVNQGWTFGGSTFGTVGLVPGPPAAWQLSDTSASGSPSYIQTLTTGEIEGLLNTSGIKMTAKIRAVANYDTLFSGQQNWAGFLSLNFPASVLPGSSGRRIGFAIGIETSNNNFQILNEQNIATPTVVAGTNTALDTHTLEVSLDPGATNYSWSLNGNLIATLPLEGGPAFSIADPTAGFLNGTSTGVGGTFDVQSFVVEPLQLTVLHVDANVVGGTGDGSSWANAFDNLQDALSAAVFNSEIRVAEGTYTPTTGTDRNATFQLIDGVAIYGGFIGSEILLSERNPNPDTNNTILSGEIGAAGNGDNSYHVVTGTGTDSSAILDGFAISDGNADGSAPDERGGGMTCFGSGAPTLRNIIFEDNEASLVGGAVYTDTASPSFTNVIFRNNQAPGTASTVSGVLGEGGAVYHNNSPSPQPSYTNCVFLDNSATNDGGAISNHNTSPNFTNCTFSGNTSPETGGAVYNSSTASTPSFTNTIVWGNTAVSEPSVTGTSSTYSYCLIEGLDPSGSGNLDGTDVANDPLFVSTTNLRLQAGSPAINAGNNSSNNTATDPDVNERLVPLHIEMGAYEFPALVFTPGPDYTVLFSSLPTPVHLASWFESTGAFNEGNGFIYTLTPAGTTGTINFLISPTITPYGDVDFTLDGFSNGTATFDVTLSDPNGIYPTSSSHPFIITAAPPDPDDDFLDPTESVGVGESIDAPNLAYTLTLQADGDLTLTGPYGIVWNSGTAGSEALTAVMQADGNFVLLDSGSSVVFSAGTSDAGSRLFVRDDGRLVIIRPDGTVAWASEAEFQNLQPTLALRYYIAVDGPYPSSGDAPEDCMPHCLGEVKLFASDAAVPFQYLPAEGQLLPVASYTSLFSLLGYRYGTTNINNFALPDLRGRIPIGIGSGPGLTTRNHADTGGVENVALTVPQLPSHTHDSFAGETDSAGSGQSHPNMQPFLALTPIICNAGSFPSQGTVCTGTENVAHYGDMKWLAYDQFAQIPGGWLKAEGQLLPISSNTILFSLVGDNYGGDGRTTFAVPDLRGRAAICSGIGNGLTNRIVAQKLGSETHTLSELEMPAHTHLLPAGGESGITGDGESHNNIMPSLVMNHMLCSATNEVRLFATTSYIIGHPLDGNAGRPKLFGRTAMGFNTTHPYLRERGYEVTTLTLDHLPTHGHVGPAYLDWISQFYPGESDPNIVGLTAQPEGQLPNVIQFVLDGDPTTTDPTILPEFSRDATNATFIFRRRNDATDRDPYVEYGSTLTGWTKAEHGIDGITIATELDGFEPGIDKVTVTIPHGGTPKLFTRLAVDTP